MIRYVIAIDPGLATGMCVFSYEPGSQPVLVWSGEVSEEEYAGVIRYYMNWAQENGHKLEVVCERFTITAQTAKKSQAPFSLELIGILKQIMRDFDGSAEDVKLQGPVDAKTMFPNPKLKKLGYWHRGGAGHALDSIRHALLYLVKTGWAPTKLLAEE